MKSISFLFLGCCLLLAGACNEKMDENEVEEIGLTQCQQSPQFINSTGLDPNRSALSTSDKRKVGLTLIQIPATDADTTKTWQAPSWSQFGYMGTIQIDENGNAYVIPVPVINILENKPADRNTIYKVDSKTAIMSPLVRLPITVSVTDENVYGLLGLYYDCQGQKLYAGSVAGSTRLEEKGTIYVVDPNDGTIVDQLNGIDAMGLCVGGVTGTKRLYFGSSRTADIYSIELTKSGKFKGNIQKEFSLDLLGPRGDDKARRMRFDKNGDLLVSGIEFNYNLTAPSEKQETIYRFRYDEDQQKWMYIE